MIENIFKLPTTPRYGDIKPSADPPQRLSFNEFLLRQDDCVKAQKDRREFCATFQQFTTKRKTPRVASSRVKDLLTAVVGGRSALSKCDLDLILRRFLIPEMPELCRRIAIDDGTYDAARLIDLANAEASPADPLHSLVIAALSNRRSTVMIPRRRQSKKRLNNWTLQPANAQPESPQSSKTPKDTLNRLSPSLRTTATGTTGTAGERYLPMFYDNLDR
jgi:hypothetical protein